jgi:hypothetical protein
MLKEIGFTGTRKGMSLNQKIGLIDILSEFGEFNFHHGACIGADIEADLIARNCYAKQIFIYPSNNLKTRVHCEEPGDIVYKEKSPLIRDQDIVNSVSILIAAPKSNIEIIRSGTWTTIRYARKKNIEVVILER